MVFATNTSKMLMVSPSCAKASSTKGFVHSIGSTKALRVTRAAKRGNRQSVSVSAAVEAPAPVIAPATAIEQAEKLLDIVFIATEVAPWSKTGGFE